MTRLTGADIDCLRRIADEPSTTAPPCADDMLKRLRDQGLIAYEPKVWAPLEAVDVRYHLTASGEEFLNRFDAGSELNGTKDDE